MNDKLRDIAWTSFIAMALACSQGMAQEPAAEAFDILEYRVLGNTVLDAATIERAVYPHLGPDRGFQSVQSARDALEAAYRERGFATALVDVPEQTVQDGVVRLKITEGRIDRVRVVNARYFSAGEIRSLVPALAPGTVPDLPRVQSELGALNRRSRDLAVTPILKAGRAPGTIDAELRVEDELPVHAGFELNDRYTANTSRLRASAILSYDNLFARGHSLQLQAQTAPEEPDESRVLSATYLMPLGETGPRLALYAVDTNSDVAAIGALSVLGRGQIFGARVLSPLRVREGFSESISGGFDYKSFDENIRVDADSEVVTPIDYLSWTIGYDASWARGPLAGGVGFGTTLAIRRGLNDTDEFAAKRSRARSNFLYVGANGEIEWTLPLAWRLYGRVAGQFATEPLINNEQFFIGGAESVRGYPEALQLGDYGFSSSLELRTPNLLSERVRTLQGLYVLGFFDTGVVSLIDPIVSEDPALSEPDRQDLTSFGAGLRLRAFDGLNIALDWAFPLVGSGEIQSGNDRFHFGVLYSF